MPALRDLLVALARMAGPGFAGLARHPKQKALPMAGKRLHLGWFMNFTPGEWDHPLATGGSHWDGRFYVDMAQALERACFDYIMIYPDSAEIRKIPLSAARNAILLHP
jgi:hypothetical protein